MDDGSSASVPFWCGEGPRPSVAGALTDSTPVNTSFQITGNPKRFAQVVGTVEKGGRFRLSLIR